METGHLGYTSRSTSFISGVVKTDKSPFLWSLHHQVQEIERLLPWRWRLNPYNWITGLEVWGVTLGCLPSTSTSTRYDTPCSLLIKHAKGQVTHFQRQPAFQCTFVKMKNEQKKSLWQVLPTSACKTPCFLFDGWVTAVQFFFKLRVRADNVKGRRDFPKVVLTAPGKLPQQNCLSLTNSCCIWINCDPEDSVSQRRRWNDSFARLPASAEGLSDWGGGGVESMSLEGAMLKTQKGDLLFHYICWCKIDLWVQKKPTYFGISESLHYTSSCQDRW